MEAICMKCQILFSGKNKINVINLWPAKLTNRAVKVKTQSVWMRKELVSFLHNEVLFPDAVPIRINLVTGCNKSEIMNKIIEEKLKRKEFKETKQKIREYR